MDYDADGDLDILSGSYTGEVYYFERGEDGQFAQGRYLVGQDGKHLVVATSITPEAVDMDADGDLDLVVGTRLEGVKVVENLGTRSEPKWSTEIQQLKTTTGVDVEGSNATHVDWDGDGLADLLVGSEQGGVRWYRNTGKADAPLYASALTLVAPYGSKIGSEAEGPQHPGTRTKVHATDWNGDGRMDLLVGDFAYMYEVLPPLTPEQEAEKAALTPAFEEARARHNDLLIEYSELTRAGQVVPDELQARIDASNEVYGPLSKQMSAFNRKKTRTHGWVWLYLGTDGERDAPAPAAPVQASKEFGPTELTVEASPLPGDPGTWRIESTLSMDQGWHTYAQVPEGRPYPATRPALIGPDGSELPVTWKALSKEWPDPDEAMQSFYTDAALFVCEVELSAEALETLEVSMNFQVCNTEVCLPPTVLSVSLRATSPD